jgi:hypothetical protein
MSQIQAENMRQIRYLPKQKDGTPLGTPSFG